MTRRRLPIGIQTFGEGPGDGLLLRGQTPWIARLVDEGKHYFLSRPPGVSERACCWTR